MIDDKEFLKDEPIRSPEGSGSERKGHSQEKEADALGAGGSPAQGAEPERPRGERFPSVTDGLIVVGIFVLAGLLIPVLVGGIYAAILLMKGVPFAQATSEVYASLHNGAAMALSYLLQFLVLIVLTLRLRRRRGETDNATLLCFSMRRFNPALLLWGIVLLFSIELLIEPLLSVFPDKYLEMIDSVVSTSGWGIFTGVLLAPVLEETFFRGVVLESLRRKSGPVRGVLLSAAAFGLMHIIPQQVISGFFAGIVLGYVYLRTRSLIPVILLHAINNCAAVVLSATGLGSDATLSDLLGNGKFYYAVYLLCVVVCVVSAVMMNRSLKVAQQADSAGENAGRE